MSFAFPWALLLLPLGLLFHRKRGQGSSLPFLFPVEMEEVISLARRTSWKVRFSNQLLAMLRLTAWCFLVIALARPQRIETTEEVEMSGRDIMLTLDISGSMQAMDFLIDNQRVDRLAALKNVIRKFIDDRPGDRFGLVVFGDKVFVQCPLTIDQKAVAQFVDALEIGMAGPGTAIGDALAVSLKRVRNIPEHSKVIVLVTDGKNNSGSVQPSEGAELAKSLGVKVHVIGIGGSEAAPFPAKDLFGVTRLVSRRMEYDEETLKMIAAVTGGVYFNAKNTDQLSDVYSQIDELERRSTKTYQNSQVEELFFIPLLIGASCLFASEILRATVFRRALS